MQITTERLLIRQFKQDDFPFVYAYVSDEETMHYLPEDTFTEGDTIKFIEKHRRDNPEAFSVVLLETNEVIGHIIFEIYFGKHTYEIGWVFNKMFHGNGYATEAARAIIAYAFETLNLHRVVATCQPENTASYRVMEKIGMRREGFFKQCIPYKDTWWDEYSYAILQPEYNDTKVKKDGWMRVPV
ncbi:N-acetyltransferase [Siminovitchia terrae]|uniref:N-acetyltransferase n=1 Tax=Siminovitchia terrae TaxID=1914933 RepID=A0A429X986_SIMTE|nr:GNAT family N-acetyltransferase [Siminovitchia terrae]RST59994.1 N-acetyltransferase [Siminovitchia terrae]